MRVFELHFNPPHLPTLLKKGETPDLVFDSFCYEPENIYEKRLGSLFLVGELRNLLPQNLKFLDNLAIFLKKQYYSTPIKFSPEASLKESLKKVNEFLEGIAKTSDVSWLGNLNLAVLSLTQKQNNWWEVNFTKVGTVKILLIRAGQIIDVGRNLEFSEIEPYPLKIFGNIVSGKLAENDIILVLTKEVFDFFSGQNLFAEASPHLSPRSASPRSVLEKIANLTPFEEKKLREILKTRGKELSNISGICFLCLLTKEAWSDEKKRKSSLTFQKEPEKFSIAQAFLPVLKIVKRIKFSRILKYRTPRGGVRQEIKRSLIDFPKLPSLKLPKLSFPRFSSPRFPSPRFPSFKFKIFPPNKKLILILFLLFFLLVGFFIFKGERAQELKSAQQVLEEVKLKKIEAENFLILKDEGKANILLQEAWNEILPQTKLANPLTKEALTLKELIQENLVLLNKLENIADPRLAEDQKKFEEKKLPQTDLPFDSFAEFRLYTYLLNSANGEILKCPSSLTKDDCRPWLKPEAKLPIEAKSMAVDGSIWILTKDNKIDRYHQGLFRETLKLNLFPYLKNPSKIWTSEFNPYLYILDPEKRRIIILTKEGKIVKQLQSEKFDNLLDFSVAEDFKTIWLLNGLKVYKIQI